MGNFLKMSYYIWFPTKWGTIIFFLFHQEFPILLDFKHSLFCRILWIWFEQISCKMGNCCYTRLNILFPILKDFKKIPQFEGFLVSSKATKWGILMGLFKKEKYPISQNNSKKTLNDMASSFGNSPFCMISCILFKQISFKMGNWNPMLNILLKIPQFEGFLMLWKATKWGIF